MWFLTVVIIYSAGVSATTVPAQYLSREACEGAGSISREKWEGSGEMKFFCTPSIVMGR